MKPGDVYRVDVPEAGDHFVIVTSRSELSRGRFFQAVPVTSQRFEERSRYANSVVFRAGDHCFTVDCVAQCEAIGLYPRAHVIDLDAGPVATLPDEVCRDIVLAVGYVMDASCEPN